MAFSNASLSSALTVVLPSLLSSTFCSTWAFMRAGPSLWALGGGGRAGRGAPAAGHALRVSRAGWQQKHGMASGLGPERFSPFPARTETERFYFFSFSFVVINGIVFRKVFPPTFGSFVLKIT